MYTRLGLPEPICLVVRTETLQPNFQTLLETKIYLLIFKFISIIMPLRVTEEDEELGLDATQHDEKYGRNPLKA